jgi:hypothetical protein
VRYYKVLPRGGGASPYYLLWQKHQLLQEVKKSQNFPLEQKIDVFVADGGMLL